MKFQKGSIRRSLYYSILDGLFTAMMVGASEAYLVPYGIALGATTSQIAFVATLPMLAAAVLMVQSAKVTQALGSRLRLIRIMVFLHAVAWVPIVAIPYVVPWPEARPWALVACVLVYTSLGNFAVPAWQSLMSDYIPANKRGRYYGWRNRLQGFLTVGASITAGLVLNAFGKGSLAGFTSIFLFAMLCRFYAWTCVRKMVEPFKHTSHDAYFSFIDFLKGMRTENFSRFTLFYACFIFSVHLSAPLLSVFLLRDLGFSYAEYMVVMTTTSIAAFLSQKAWGAQGDRVGNVKAARLAAWGVAVVPLFWLVSHNLVWVFFVQAAAGCAWGGLAILINNFMVEAVSAERRIRSISYLNLLVSVAAVLGTTTGALLIHRLPPLFGYSFLTLFLLSCAARVAVMLFLSGTVSEDRRL